MGLGGGLLLGAAMGLATGRRVGMVGGEGGGTTAGLGGRIAGTGCPEGVMLFLLGLEVGWVDPPSSQYLPFLLLEDL